MSCTRDRHSDEKLQEFLNGELSEREADDIRAHAEICADCRQVLEELTTVRNLLQSDAPLQPLRPMWPGVREKLDAAARPRFRLVFAMGTSAAAAAGIILGLFLGSLSAESSRVGSEGVWADVTTTLTDSRSGGIADVFFGAGTQEGDVSQ